MGACGLDKRRSSPEMLTVDQIYIFCENKFWGEEQAGGAGKPSSLASSAFVTILASHTFALYTTWQDKGCIRQFSLGSWAG